MDRLDEIVKSVKKSGYKAISGNDAFVLYDTFGFPLEMTTEMAIEQGLTVDTEGFTAEMSRQRERGKQSWKGNDIGLDAVYDEIISSCGNSEFLGYESEKAEGKILSLYRNTSKVDTLTKGDNGLIVLDQSMKLNLLL